jgi:hypothetical protein
VHPERERIEALRAGGATLDSLASRFHVHRDAVHRHMRHVPQDRIANYLAGVATIAELRERAAAENGSVLDYLASLRSLLMGAIVRRAEAQSASSLMMLSGRMIQVLEAIGKLTGEIERNNPSIAITNNVAITMSDPKMVALQSGLLSIGRAHPAARSEIVALLRALDAAPGARLAGALQDGASAPETAASGVPWAANAQTDGPPMIEGSAA